MRPLLSTMTLGPTGPLDHPAGVLPPHRESHGRRRPLSPPRPLLLPPRRSPRYQSRPTVIARSLGDPFFYDFRLFLATCRLYVQSYMSFGDAAELQCAASVARYSHADWDREQQAEPMCHTAMRYITIARPSALPLDGLSCYPSHQRPSHSDIQELAGKGR